MSGKVFGVPLAGLMSKEDDAIPDFLERLFSSIEQRGLYIEGIYRKPGAAAIVRQLESDLNASTSLNSPKTSMCILRVRLKYCCCGQMQRR